MIGRMANIMETIEVMESEDGNETQQFKFVDLHKIQSNFGKKKVLQEIIKSFHLSTMAVIYIFYTFCNI